ncbi:3,4-dihydroxy-2-butanone 4-phosphate synthase [Abortiporus biennis]
MAPVATLETTSATTTTNSVLKAPTSNSSNGQTIPSVPGPSTSTARPREVLDAPLRTEFAFDSIDEALESFKNGGFLVVMDDEGRENEGDLIIAGSEVSTEKMAWMIKHTSGYICISLPGERLEELEIPMMVADNQDPNRTAYTVTVDYKHGTTTGISAHDRALTARALASPLSLPSHFSRPGHMVPLRARQGGVLTRPGHTESGIDLCILAGLPKAGVLCELVNDDEEGTMMRRDSCRAFADKWGIKMISVEMIKELRRRVEV